MTIDLTNASSPVTSASALKFTNTELDYLQSFLSRGDRAGYYMALYNFTGNTQCLEHAQISTFSEGSGGVAYAANYLLQNKLAAGSYPGIYYMSQKVAEFSLTAIREKLDRNRANGNINTGYININEMLLSANDAWAKGWLQDDPINGKDLQRYFPGNLLDGLSKLNHDFNLPPLPDQTSVLQSIVIIANDLLLHGQLNPESFRNRLLSEGALAGVLGLADGWLVGKQLNDYTGDPQHYGVRALPDSTYKVVTNLSTNKVVGVFNNELIPSTVSAVLNQLALSFPTIVATLAGGPAAGFTVSVMSDFFRLFMTDFHKSLSESTTPDFNGDINPLKTNVFLGSTLYSITDTGTVGNDTRWGTGGSLSLLHSNTYSDTLRGGSGDDRMFGGDGGDELHGDDGHDIAYGQSGSDTLYGEAGADTLRGGAGNDILDGGADNDVLDGDDLNPAAAGDDRLAGGGGNDLLVGGKGNDTLAGAAGTWSPGDHASSDNDTLIGGAGDDTYFFCCTFGHDTVIDSDGKGKLMIEGVQLTGGKAVPGTPNLYMDTSNIGNISWYYLVGNKLFIGRTGIEGTIEVRDWKPGQLGITLTPAPPATPDPRTTSPLVLDMDGEGIETLGTASNVHLDHKGDGFAGLTGWVGPDDALLARDLNHDGKITSGAELFGSETLLASGAKASNGFEALRQLDLNNDGRVDEVEAGVAGLYIWKDANSNGLSEGNELTAMRSGTYNFSPQPEALYTGYGQVQKTDANGNQLLQVGNFISETGVAEPVLQAFPKGKNMPITNMHAVVGVVNFGSKGSWRVVA
jgi:Ca2+-binding RTX toxin-like protein